MDAGPFNPYILRKGFYNETIEGSRFYSDRLYVYGPPSGEFCNQTLPNNAPNVIGNGVCGVNGYAFPAGIYGTSSYEKDGHVSIFSATGVYGRALAPGASTRANFTVVNTNTLYYVGERPESGFFNSITHSFLNDDEQIAGTQAVYLQGIPDNPIAQVQVFLFTRVTREAWLAAIEEEYSLANVLKEDQIDVEAIGGCLSGDECPTEVDWCTIDPNCSTSPYQEPDASLKAGPIVGFVLLGVVIIVALIVGFFYYKIRTLRKQARHDFARRVAESVTLTPGSRQLSPEALAEEFKKIDRDHNGTISKDELWEFV